MLHVKYALLLKDFDQLKCGYGYAPSNIHNFTTRQLTCLVTVTIDD